MISKFSSKAQLFSLDLVISMILIVLVIGVLVHSFELRSYDLREKSNLAELGAVSSQASSLIFESSPFACTFLYDGASFIMPNCLDTSASFNKVDLGLSDFKCNISVPISVSISTDCTDLIPDYQDASITNFLTIERNVVFTSGDVSYSEFYDCRKNQSCVLEEGSFILRVWK